MKNYHNSYEKLPKEHRCSLKQLKPLSPQGMVAPQDNLGPFFL
jgi:hypothetical protein